MQKNRMHAKYYAIAAVPIGGLLGFVGASLFMVAEPWRVAVTAALLSVAMPVRYIVERRWSDRSLNDE